MSAIEEGAYAGALMLLPDLDTGQAALLKGLCRSACAALSRRLRPEVTPEDCREDFQLAVTLWALGCLHQADDARNLDYIRAGDVTLRQREGDSQARCLFQAAEDALAPYLADRFSFRGV